MIDKFLLWSGSKIPFIEIEESIVQPKLKEIAMVEEDNFFIAAKILTFSKNSLSEKDKLGSEDKTNFDIIMSIVNNPNNAQLKSSVLMLLTIIFPDYFIDLEGRILLIKSDVDKSVVKVIDSFNYESFSEKIKEIFCLKFFITEQDFNPQGKLSREIAEKIKKGRAIVAKEKGQNQENFSLLCYYSELLCMNGYSPEEVNNLTLYQLYILGEKYKNKVLYEQYERWKIAGAKDIENLDHWMNFSDEKKK